MDVRRFKETVKIQKSVKRILTGRYNIKPFTKKNKMLNTWFVVINIGITFDIPTIQIMKI